MREELEQCLYNDFPQFFRERGLSVYESCMAFGPEIEDGWFGLLWNMCLEIQNTNPPSEFCFAQIKEKFGDLTVYCNQDTDEISKIIQEFEKKSRTICEYCGSTRDVTRSGSWIKTLCAQCRTGKVGSGESAGSP